MNKKLKISHIICFTICIILIFSIGFGVLIALSSREKINNNIQTSLSESEEKEETVVLHDELSVKDIYIPEDMDKENIGLFWYDENCELVRADNEVANFDPTKPIIIYFHGWGYGSGMRSPSYWQSLGYNVGNFRWGEMSTADPFGAQSKLWGTNRKRQFYWEREDGSLEYDDVPDHSVSEIFIAFYNDFMKRYDYTGSEIHLVGHSLGAQCVLASCNYMLNGIKNGTFNSTYLPDRITMLDPFLLDTEDATKVAWLENRTLKDGGSTKIAYETVKELYDYGVVVEGARTSIVKASGNLYGTGYYGYFEQYVTWVDPSSDWILEGGADITNLMDMSDKHNYAITWFDQMAHYAKTAKDYSYEGEYGLSTFLSGAYVYSRIGVLYDMPTNAIDNYMEDDYQYSNISIIYNDSETYRNVTNPQISGFAFNDINKNGINDDRVVNRISGIKVKLYTADGDFVKETITAKSGYYEFILDDTAIGKSYYIEIELADGYSVTILPDNETKEENDMNYNTISESLISENVTILNSGSLRILNIGLINK